MAKTRVRLLEDAWDDEVRNCFLEAFQRFMREIMYDGIRFDSGS